jgi:hypothetical protein
VADRRARISVITDWRVRDEDLPDVAPGADYERVIAPQKFVALRRIVVRDLALVRLQVGAVEEVPFELESAEGPVRTYRLGALGDDGLRRRLVETGAAVTKIVRDIRAQDSIVEFDCGREGDSAASAKRAVTNELIAIAPGLEVRVVLRNDRSMPAKPRAALIVHEEVER